MAARTVLHHIYAKCGLTQKRAELKCLCSGSKVFFFFGKKRMQNETGSKQKKKEF